MSEAEPVVRSWLEGEVLVLELHRPDHLNALDRDAHLELQDALDQAVARDEVRAVVLTGAGRAFCAGGDVHDMAARPDRTRLTGVDLARARADERGRLALVQHTARTLVRFPKPLVAAIDGLAAGSGLSVALACDLRVLGEDAAMHLSFVKAGLPGDTGITALLGHTVGGNRARELPLDARSLAAAEAPALRLVHEPVPADEVRPRALAHAARLGGRGAAVADMVCRPSAILADLDAVLGRGGEATLAAEEELVHRRAVERFARRPDAGDR